MIINKIPNEHFDGARMHPAMLQLFKYKYKYKGTRMKEFDGGEAIVEEERQ